MCSEMSAGAIVFYIFIIAVLIYLAMLAWELVHNKEAKP
jgi:hypothetical protein